MIIYGKHWGAVNLLFRFYGASWPRAFVLALIPTVAAVVLRYYDDPPYQNSGKGLGIFTHQNFFREYAPYTAFATIVTFFLTFRTQLSFTRYSEAVTTVKTMTARVADVAMQVAGSTEFEAEQGDPNKESPAAVRFRDEMLHLLSLVHGLALQQLRGDSDLNNLTLRMYDDKVTAPQADPGKDEFWMSLRRKSFRSMFFLRTSKTHFRDYWKARPIPVLGGLSASEVNALQKSETRVWLALSWVWRLIHNYLQKTGASAPPAHMREIYKMMSEVFYCYSNALKLVLTPFPFPLAQSATILLYILCILTPFAAVRHAGQVALAGILTFVITFAVHLINEVALEIEDPFKYDPNDLPSPLYQHDLNSNLITVFMQGPFPRELGILFGHKENIVRAIAMAVKGPSDNVIDIDSPETAPKPLEPVVLKTTKASQVTSAGPLRRDLVSDGSDDSCTSVSSQTRQRSGPGSSAHSSPRPATPP